MATKGWIEHDLQNQYKIYINITNSEHKYTTQRPISVEVSRYQLLGSCDPIIGSATGAVDSQRDALTHRA